MRLLGILPKISSPQGLKKLWRVEGLIKSVQSFHKRTLEAQRAYLDSAIIFKGFLSFFLGYRLKLAKLRISKDRS